MREELAELDEYLRLARNIREWTASTSMSGRVASRRNVTRRPVVVLAPSFPLQFHSLPGAKRPSPVSRDFFPRLSTLRPA